MSSTTDAVHRFHGGVKKIGTTLIELLAITTALIADLSITTVKLAANAVTRAKLGSEALETVWNVPDSNIVQGTTVFLGLAGEAPNTAIGTRVRPSLRSGNLKRLHVRTRVNTLNVALTITVQRATIDTAMVIVIAAGSVNDFVDTRDIAIAENDLVSIKAVAPAGVGAADLTADLEAAYSLP